MQRVKVITNKKYYFLVIADQNFDFFNFENYHLIYRQRVLEIDMAQHSLKSFILLMIPNVILKSDNIFKKLFKNS